MLPARKVVFAVGLLRTVARACMVRAPDQFSFSFLWLLYLQFFLVHSNLCRYVSFFSSLFNIWAHVGKSHYLLISVMMFLQE